MLDELDQMILDESNRQSSEQGTAGGESGSSEEQSSASQEEGGENQSTENSDVNQEQNENNAGTEGGEQQQEGQQQQSSESSAKPTNNDADNVFSERLGLISGGKFKTEAELKEILSSYEVTKQELFDMKGKNPFANDFEKRRNELILGGATKEALKSFEAINDLGDLSKMDSREIKINKLILVDGYPRKMAEKEVDDEFPIESEEDEEQKEYLQLKLKKSAEKDAIALKDFEVEVSTVTPAQESRLFNEAQKTELVNSLKPHLENLIAKASNLTTLNLNAKEGDEAIKLDIVLSADDKAQLRSDVENFMVDNSLPLTQENYDQAVGFARERLILSKFEESNQKTWAKAEAYFTKKLTEEYENPSGKPNGGQKPGKNTTEDAKALKQWEDEMIGG